MNKTTTFAFCTALVIGLVLAATGARSSSMADPGFQHQSFVSSPAPATGGVDSVIAFNADLIPFMKNDGAVDVLVSFDNNGKLATTAAAGIPYTLKAGETWTFVPVRTAHVALHSTGAASAVRIAGVW